MQVQADNSGTKSVIFTGLWSLLHAAAADSKHLYLSKNLMVNTGHNGKSHWLIENNYIIMEALFFFVFATVVKTYGSKVVLPPGFRKHYQNPNHNPPCTLFFTPKVFYPVIFVYWELAIAEKGLGLAACISSSQ